MKIAGIAFGLWSLFIPFGVLAVRESVISAISSQAEFQKQFAAYVLTMERRITLLEEKQSTLSTRMEKIDVYHSNLENRDRAASRSADR